MINRQKLLWHRIRQKTDRNFDIALLVPENAKFY